MLFRSMLEKENGIDVLTAMLSANRDICCLMITGREEINSALLSLRHGAVDYLSKSISSNELLEALDRAAEKIQLREAKQDVEQEIKLRNEELKQINARLYDEIQERVRAENSALNAMRELVKTNVKLKNNQDELQNRVKQQTDELISKNTQYSILAENAADGLFIHDDQGVIIEINQSALTNLGYAAEQLTSLDIFDIDVGVTKQVLLATWMACEPDNAVSIDSVQRRKDGSTFSVEVRISAYYQKEKKYLLSIARDVTERKIAEIALRESELKLRSIIESAEEGILVVDSHDQLMHTNCRFQTMWHISNELIAEGDDSAILDHCMGQLIEPESFCKLVKDLYDSNRESTDILHFNDGRIFERYTRPLQRMEGTKMEGRIWVFHDITKHEQAEQDLQLYQLMVESTSDPMFVIDNETADRKSVV